MAFKGCLEHKVKKLIREKRTSLVLWFGLFVLTTVAISVGASTVSRPSQPTSLVKIGDCLETSISEIGYRLKNTPGSGTFVKYENGSTSASWENITNVYESTIGDRVRLCLTEIEKGCALGKEGKTYSVENLRTGKGWVASDSFRQCEPAQEVGQRKETKEPISTSNKHKPLSAKDAARAFQGCLTMHISANDYWGNIGQTPGQKLAVSCAPEGLLWLRLLGCDPEGPDAQHCLNQLRLEAAGELFRITGNGIFVEVEKY